MSSLRQVVYISEATARFNKAELDDLVGVSRRNNQDNDITGAMLFLENSFIQVLEGEEAAIGQLLDKLHRDTRHQNIRIISDQLVTTRNFQNWSMGIVTAPEEDKPQVLQEIHLASKAERSVNDLSMIMPACQTFMMMRRLYDTSNVLQRAKNNLSA